MSRRSNSLSVPPPGLGEPDGEPLELPELLFPELKLLEPPGAAELLKELPELNEPLEVEGPPELPPIREA